MMAALALLATAVVLSWWSSRAYRLRRYGVAVATAVAGTWLVALSMAAAYLALVVRPGG